MSRLDIVFNDLIDGTLGSKADGDEETKVETN